MNELLAVGAWTLDVAFFVILLLGILFGVVRGFVKSVCKIAGTVFSAVVAFMFCVTLQNSLEGWFGLLTALAGAIGNATIAKVIALVISFILLFLVVKLLAWFVGKTGTALVNKFAPCRTINRILGGILGLFEAFMLIMLLLAICHWIPVDGMHEFIQSSTIVGKVFDWVVSELSKVSIDDLIKEVTPQAFVFSLR